MTDPASITFSGVAIGAILVFIGFRVRDFAHNIQDLQQEVLAWADGIYTNEFVTVLNRQPIDSNEVMSVAIKHFTVKRLHTDLEIMERKNNKQVKVEIMVIMILAGILGLSFLLTPDAPFGELFEGTLDSFVFYVPLIAVALVGFVVIIWNNFREHYANLRKKIKSRIA